MVPSQTIRNTEQRDRLSRNRQPVFRVPRRIPCQSFGIRTKIPQILERFIARSRQYAIRERAVQRFARASDSHPVLRHPATSAARGASTAACPTRPCGRIRRGAKRPAERRWLAPRAIRLAPDLHRLVRLRRTRRTGTSARLRNNLVHPRNTPPYCLQWRSHHLRAVTTTASSDRGCRPTFLALPSRHCAAMPRSGSARALCARADAGGLLRAPSTSPSTRSTVTPCLPAPQPEFAPKSASIALRTR